jgi:hypothetical protein
VDNAVSIEAHRRRGFEELERVVCFRRLIPSPPEKGAPRQGPEDRNGE